MSNLNFNKMENAIQIGFSKTAPDYRIISKGLNLEGTCSNKDCEVYNKSAWCKHGFGDFNFNMITKISKCPICKENLKDINNVGYYLCSWEG
mmetsp:Transcript_4561/g.409  ORF Transcript_4561/g.409 Transcript_4561/m.409 type:complete len:92 (+) Transcript_4561:301-576(+)